MATIEIHDRAPQPTLSIRQTIAPDDLIRFQGESLHALWRLLHERAAAPAGPPFVRYHTFGGEQTDVEVGVPVDGDVAGQAQITRGELPAGRAVVAVHEGGHDRLAEAYQAIEQALPTHGAADGPAWEVYEWIDLSQEPDPSRWPAPADWRTQIVQPIR